MAEYGTVDVPCMMFWVNLLISDICNPIKSKNSVTGIRDPGNSGVSTGYYHKCYHSITRLSWGLGGTVHTL